MRHSGAIIQKDLAMLVDVYRNWTRDRVLLIEDGKGLSGISDTGSEFLADMEFEHKWDTESSTPPYSLKKEVVLLSLDEHGYYAAALDIQVKIVE